MGGREEARRGRRPADHHAGRRRPMLAALRPGLRAAPQRHLQQLALRRRLAGQVIPVDRFALSARHSPTPLEGQGNGIWLRAGRSRLPRPGGERDGVRGIGPLFDMRDRSPSPDPRLRRGSTSPPRGEVKSRSALTCDCPAWKGEVGLAQRAGRGSQAIPTRPLRGRPPLFKGR